MRIGVVSDILDHHATGIHVFTRELLSAAIATDTTNQYVIIHYQPNQHPLFQLSNVEDIIIPTGRFDRKRTLAKFFLLPRVLRRLNLDVIFDPTQVAVFQSSYNAVTIGTIYDTIFMYYPEHFDWISLFLNKVVLRRATRFMDHIITVSENSKRDIMKFYSIPDERITVIHAGLDHSVFNATALSNVQIERLRSTYNLPERFLLFIGTLVPHKNTRAVLQAFYQIRHNFSDVHLVIVGKSIWKKDQSFQGLGAEFFERVIFTEFVPDEDLAGLYRLASVFVFPSFYEGFGMPVIEAMASGCPVITSRGGSLPEVAGDAAHYCDATNFTTLAEGVKQILSDSTYAAALRQRGLARAKQYTWQQAAHIWKYLLIQYTAEHESSNKKINS